MMMKKSKSISPLPNDNDSGEPNHFNHDPKTIPKGTKDIIIEQAGYEQINGEYRINHLVDNQKYIFFTEHGSYCLNNDLNVQDVCKELKHLNDFKNLKYWNDELNQNMLEQKCWTITNLDQDVIYYAAPLVQNSLLDIPNYNWISVHGSSPAPNLRINEAHLSSFSNSKDQAFNKSGFSDLRSQSINEDNDEEEESVSDIEQQ